VFVRNENGSEIFRHPADGGKPLADLARAEPGVHEHAGLTGFDVGTIATGTAAEDGKFDGHKRTLVSWKETGNFFSTTSDLTSVSSEHKLRFKYVSFPLNVKCGTRFAFNSLCELKQRLRPADFSR
jgi:hypothetical protein